MQDGRCEKLLATILKLSGRLIVDHPHAKPAPFMGPVIDNAAADHLQQAVGGMERSGGRIIKPLERPSPELPFLTPAIIDVTEIAERPDEELFGPA